MEAEKDEATQDSPNETVPWEKLPSVLYEQRIPYILYLILAALLLYVAFTAMAMGHSFWQLYLVFYIVGAATLAAGMIHLICPVIRRDGSDLLGYSCGMLPKIHRLPHTAVSAIQIKPAIGTKKHTRWFRFDIALLPKNGKAVPLGERHLLQSEAKMLKNFSVPETERTDEKEKVSFFCPAVLVELALLLVGIVCLIVTLMH